MNATTDLSASESGDSDEKVPLVFFYTGQSLPGYSYNAMRHAVSVWGEQVVLICDIPAPRVPPGVLVIDYTPWFQQQALEATIAQNKINSDFRSGFWSASLKRFFVLHQYMEVTKIEKVAHTELDSVIFASRKDLFSRDLPSPGLFIPWNPPQLAIGSFVLVNGRESIQRLIRFATTTQGFSNEMELLTSFLSDPTEPGFGLPTVDALMYPEGELAPVKNLLTEDHVGWRFDAARLGQWVLGVDPRNLSGTFSTNHFTEPGMTPVKVANGRGQENPVVWVRDRATSSRLANLHVHSKRIGQATSPTQRAIWFAVANLPFASFVGINTSRIRKRCSRAIGRTHSRIFTVIQGLLRTVRK